MPKQKEEPPRLRAKVRAQLPGESWREHVSAGAQKAHDYPLGPAREEASALRKKGRLIAAHKREKAAYKIRVRGYQRKYSHKEPVEKAITYNAWKLGPAAKKRVEVRLRKKTKAEMRNETIKAIGGSLGGVRTIGALGLGAGGASLVDMKNDAKQKTHQVGEVIRNKVKPDADSDLEKGWVKDDAIGIHSADTEVPVVTPHRKGIRPHLSTTYIGDVEELTGKPVPENADYVRLKGHTRSHRKKLYRAAKKAESGERIKIDDKYEYQVQKGMAVYQITAETMVRDVALREIAKSDVSLVEIAKFGGLIKPLKAIAQGGQDAYKAGGLQGLETYGRQQWAAPRNTFGGQSLADKASGVMGNPTARKAAIGAGVVGGAGLAAYGAKKMLAPAVKKKAKKYALYGAAGLGGTVAAGTALGNAATNR